MLRRTILLATALALVAIVSPAAAPANWTNNGLVIPSGINPDVLFEGSAEFSGGIGSVTCNKGVTATLQLTGGTTDGHVKVFAVDDPATNCAVGGLLNILCGPKSLTEAKLDQDATVSVNTSGKDLSVTNVDLTNTFGACLGGPLTLENTIVSGKEVPLTVKVDSGTNQEINEVKLTGDLYEPTFEESVTVEATMQVIILEGPYGFE
jgi:hypothetical protein